MTEEFSNERSNNFVALTIALLAAFMAVTTIKGSNVSQKMEEASAERVNSWAWYQAVRTREDITTNYLADLQRAARTDSDTALQAQIAEQVEYLDHTRTRLAEVQERARAVEAEQARLAKFDDQYDISSALISIAMAILAVCLLMRARWLFWFSLAPAGLGIAFGLAAVMEIPIQAGQFFAWLG